MALAVKDLIDAGVHYGHRASRWNPKMKPYIYSKRNLIHIIDLKETVRGLLRSIKYFNRIASGGGLILFVGTKRQAAEIIQEHATRCGMPYITERWLGGTLTNFQTIRSRLERLEELESILDGEQASTYSKKMLATLGRERRKIARNLEGIRHMTRRPEAMLVIDPHRERIAVKEARKLGVKIVALLDTDCDPDDVDLPIPGNDDSMRSIELVVSRLADAILQGKASAPAEPPPRAEEPSGPGGLSGRRGGGDRDRRGSGGGPGIGSSRGMAARTAGANPVLAPSEQPGDVVPHGPEGGGPPANEIPSSAPMGAEPQAGIVDEPPPTPDDTPMIAPAAVDQAQPGSEGVSDLPPSATEPKDEPTHEPKSGA